MRISIETQKSEDKSPILDWKELQNAPHGIYKDINGRIEGYLVITYQWPEDNISDKTIIQIGPGLFRNVTNTLGDIFRSTKYKRYYGSVSFKLED